MKKLTKKSLLAATVGILAIALILITFAACNVKPTTPVVKAPAAKDVYAIAAVSGVSMLKDISASSIANAAFAEAADEPAAARPDGITDESVARIKQYIKMFEGYLLGDGISSTDTAVTETDGEYAAKYERKMTLSTQKIDGSTDTYVMYYTETDKKTETEEEEGETETSSKLNGVIVFGETEYPIVGEKELEAEEGETEEELSIKIMVSETDTGTYIHIKQEIEANEIEYVYSVYENGNLLSETTVEFENDTEDNEQEFAIEFLDKSTNPNQRVYYEIENAKDENYAFDVKYRVDQKTNKLSVAINEGVYTFAYRNGFTEEV